VEETERKPVTVTDKNYCKKQLHVSQALCAVTASHHIAQSEARQALRAGL